MTKGLSLLAAATSLAAFSSLPAIAAPVNNIVLVHGAWADGSGWKGVYDILTKDGYKVSVVANPDTGVADDVAATQRVLDRQVGPVILVGHSYGGTVITEAGIDPKVVGLVYIAAFGPDDRDDGAVSAQGAAADRGVEGRPRLPRRVRTRRGDGDAGLRL